MKRQVTPGYWQDRVAGIVRRGTRLVAALALAGGWAIVGFGQTDPLVGRWEGKIVSIQGERPTAAVFVRNGEGYGGKTLGLRPGTEVVLKNVKVEGETVTANAELETPQATLAIAYTFKLAGEAMKGQGALDFGGQSISFDIELRRVSPDTEAPLVTPGAAAANGGGGRAGGAGGAAARPASEQPQQKQSPDYFAGQWSFKYLGRESGLGPAPRQGTSTMVKRSDGRTLDVTIEGKTDAGTYRESAVFSFDETFQSFTLRETLANGVSLQSRADWSSPISIRFAIDPIDAAGQKLQLRRILTIVSAHSFTLVEELSENGGPFFRLGSALYTRLGSR